MSYYQPGTLVNPHQIPQASSSRHPLHPTIPEEEIVPSSKQGDKGKAKEKKVKKMTVEDMERLAGQICNVRPLGACQRPQSTGSLYCTNHSRQAINADGDRCGNWVGNPRESRFCANGWHMENSRHTHLSDLLAYRRALNQRQTTEREKQNAAQLFYIEQRFPSSSSSSSSSSSTASSDAFSPSIPGTPISSSRTLSGNGASSGNGEIRWGAHGIDTWWRGNWGLNSDPITITSQSQIRRNSS